MEKVRLIGKSLPELQQIVATLGMPRFTAGQIAQWIYKKHVMSIDEMTNLSKKNREMLSEKFCIGATIPLDSQHSKDGTVKYLFPTEDGHYVETVFIPDHDRATLCVSCQVGCKMNCMFCATGKQGWEGNLTVADIINQIYAVPEWEQLTNIVFMGQGEPMDNLDNILAVTQVLTAEYGYTWSPKRITVSSVGIKNKLKRFLDESDCHVAISMHTPVPEQRAQIMPAEKAFSITEVVALLGEYDFSHQRRLSFEYTVFGGFNDTQMHTREIVRLLQGLDCRVNLIRYHKVPGVELNGSDMKRMESMRDYLTAHGIYTTIRASRGEDILAACGLLSTAKKDNNI